MGLEEMYRLETIRNTTAEEVYRRVEQLLARREDVCKCEACVLDLVAFTLNHVTPRYYASLLGDLHPDARQQKRIEVEIDLALESGLRRIGRHAHHD